MTRKVDTRLWIDSKWVNDIPNIKERYLWLYLLSCPQSQIIGIWYMPLEQIALHTNLDIDEVRQFLYDLAEKKMLLYDKNTEEIIIFNYPKYNIFGWNDNIKIQVENELSNVKNLSFINIMAIYLSNYIINHSNDRKIKFLSKSLELYESALKPLIAKEKGKDKEKTIDIDVDKDKDVDIDKDYKEIYKEKTLYEKGINIDLENDEEQWNKILQELN